MAEVANIVWPVESGRTYKIEYKKHSDSVWIVAYANVSTSPQTITGLESDTLYDFAVSTHCGLNDSGRRITTQTTPNNYIWIGGLYTCEQDSIFTLDTTVTGLSSPARLMYDEPTDRYYVIDADDTTALIWWFDPDTFVSAGDRNYVSGQPVFSPNYIQATDVDPSIRTLFGAGPNSGGLMAYKVSTNTYTLIPYGTNGSFSRLLVKVLGNTVYCSNSAGTPSITLVDKNLLAVTSTVSIGSIPSGSLYFNNSYQLGMVGSNVWVTASAGRIGAGAGNIAIYNSTLTTLIGTITLPGVTGPAWSSAYWQSHFHDVDKGIWYAHDIGSSTLHIIDTATLTIIDTIVFNNRQGKSNVNIGFDINSVNEDMYMSYIGLDDPADGSMILRYYKFNRDTYERENMILGTTASQLTNRIGTNEFWAISTGTAAWQATPDWMTDGQAFKYVQ